MSDEIVKAHVRKWLAANVQAQEEFAAKVAELEAAGRRIVNSGQVGAYGDDDRAPWEVTDWRTGDVLASERGTYEEYEARLSELDPEDRWIALDNVSMEIGVPDPGLTPGLPESLCLALVEWLENSAGAEELASWLGEPVDVIEHQMRNETEAMRVK